VLAQTTDISVYEPRRYHSALHRLEDLQAAAPARMREEPRGYLAYRAKDVRAKKGTAGP